MSELKHELHPRNDQANDEGASSTASTEVTPQTTDEGVDELVTRSMPGRKRRRKKKRNRRLTLAVLPTLLTLGNAVCGLAAISIAMSSTLDWELENQLLVAGILIFGGMLFDALDGSAPG